MTASCAGPVFTTVYVMISMAGVLTLIHLTRTPK